MRRIAGALIGIFAYASAASAGPGDACAVAAHLVHADAALPRVAAAIKAKNAESRRRRNRIVDPARARTEPPPPIRRGSKRRCRKSCRT